MEIRGGNAFKKSREKKKETKKYKQQKRKNPKWNSL
jgi:hypothetical protein